MSLALGLFVWGVKRVVHNASNVFAVTTINVIRDGLYSRAISKSDMKVLVRTAHWPKRLLAKWNPEMEIRLGGFGFYADKIDLLLRGVNDIVGILALQQQFVFGNFIDVDEGAPASVWPELEIGLLLAMAQPYPVIVLGQKRMGRTLLKGYLAVLKLGQKNRVPVA